MGFDVFIWKNRFWVRLCKIPTTDDFRFGNLKFVYYFNSMNKLLVTYNLNHIGFLDIESLKITVDFNQFFDAYVCCENLLMLKDDDEALLENPEILRRKIKNRQSLLEITLR